MTESTYLIAIALINQGDKRIMPIGGKSLKAAVSNDNFPTEEASIISLELLLRVIERSENGSIKSANGIKSIFLLELAIENIQEVLPSIKAKWINYGDTDLLIKEIVNSCRQVWNIEYLKGSGINYIPVKG